MQVSRGSVSRLARACACAAGAALLLLASLGGIARADILNATAELDVNLFQTKTKDPSGKVISDAHGNEFTHKYNISLNMNPYPLMRVTGGAVYLQDINTVHDIETSSHSTSSNFSPYLDVMLTNTLYSLGAGYARSESSQQGTGGGTPTTINEEYHATLSWRPEGFPDLALRATHANTFDAQRLVSDATNDTVNLASRYMYKTLSLGYAFSGSDSQDHLRNLENTTLVHNGQASYSGQFLDKRVTFYSNYNVSLLESTTKASGAGTVDTPLFPVSALSAFNPDPSVGTPDQNLANPALIDGNLSTSAGINLGVVTPSTFNKWSMGVDFGLGSAVQVNKLLVYIDLGTRQMPAGIANAFQWQLWVRNLDTDNWTQIDQSGNPVPPNSATYVPATFNQFQNGQQLPHFEISFAGVKTRFIKLVVNTLPENVALANPSFQNPDRLFVTELQSFQSLPASQAQGSSSRTSQSLSVDIRTRLLDSPSLYHSLDFAMTSTSPGGGLSYVLANNLLLDQKLSKVFTLGAVVGREDISSSGLKSTAYTYSASLRATPLSGLSHSLVYSGRSESSAAGTIESNSVYLNNTAQVYKGIAFNLAGGYTVGTSVTGQKAESVSFVGGTSINPRQDLSFNLSYSHSANTASGGGLPTSTTVSQNGTMGISYRPFPNLNLFVSYGVQQAQGQPTQYTQNYGANWSPFPDGDLQITLAYNENIASLNNEKDTSATSTINWKIAPKAILGVSYSLLTTDSLQQSSESNFFSMILQLAY